MAEETLTELPLGWSVKQNTDLLVPIHLSNEKERQEVLGREAMFSFPSATAGWFLAGPPGVLGGHIVGAIAGFARDKRIHDAEDA